MRFYRVEHGTLKYEGFPYGPYGPRWVGLHIGCFADMDRPSWQSETGRPLPEGWRHGFPTIAALARWFEPERRERFAKAGFVVREYDAPNAEAAEQQVIFNPETAIAVSIIPWSEISEYRDHLYTPIPSGPSLRADAGTVSDEGYSGV